MILYNAARLGLAGLIGYATYICGYWSLRVMRVQDLPGRPQAMLAVRLVAGFATLSLLMFLLGLWGLYYRATATILMLGLFAAAPDWSIFRLGAQRGRLAVMGIIASLAAVLLANRALLIGETDNDVWEHYLHYYDLALRSHRVWPNDLWVHFYVSKAAGLFFLAGLLGDVFSVQLVSWLAVLLMALIAHVFVRSATRAVLPGVIAAALVLASWNAIGGDAGSTLKHHTVSAMLLIAVFWCAWEYAVQEDRRTVRGPLAAGLMAGFYIGVHVTVAAGIAVAGLVAMALVLAIMRRARTDMWSLGLLAAGPVLGSAAVLALNYTWTGLALDAPVGIFWPLADRQRFAEFWSPLVVDYWFVGPASVESARVTLAGFLGLDPLWWGRVLRVPLTRPVWLAAAGLIAAALLCKLLVKRPAAPDAVRSDAVLGLASIGAFLAGALLVAQLFRNSESVYRLYAFALPLVIGALVVVWHMAAASITAGHRLQVLLVLLAAVSVLGILRQIPSERWQTVAAHAMGALSTNATLRHAERSFPGRTSVELMLQFRARVADSRRVLFLTYDPAPAYFLPAPPVVSEPSYAFGTRYAQLLFSGDAARTEQILKAANIGYVAVNLRNRLFLGLPYTNLFSNDGLRARLGLAWRRDGVYFLGWQSDGVSTPLPEDFLVAMQAKRTGAIPQNAEQLWGKDVAAALRAAPATRDQGSSYFNWLYDEMKDRYRRSGGR